MSPPQPEIIAHRGYSGRAPENTLAAVAAAVEAGAPAVEWDVRIARCGTPVLFHDDTLDRTTNGRGELEAHTAAELASLDAGAWFAPEFAGEPVPSLAAAVEAARAWGLQIYCEIKGARAAASAETIWAVFAEHRALDRTTFISMQWEALDRIGTKDPHVRLGYIAEEPERFEPALERVRGDSRKLLDPDYRILLDHPEWAELAQAQDTRLAVWTVNDPGEAAALARLGVSGFTTNEVEALLEWAKRPTR